MSSISRRGFFIKIFTGTVKQAEEILPESVREMLGSNRSEPLSPEEAAFELVKSRRKQSGNERISPIS
jgi:hypothetical protein